MPVAQGDFPLDAGVPTEVPQKVIMWEVCSSTTGREMGTGPLP